MVSPSTPVLQLAPLLLLLLLTSPTSASVDQCPRYSPAEIWHSDVAPWMQDIILELKIYFHIVFEKLDGNLFHFMPHIAKDPLWSSNVTTAFHQNAEMIQRALDETYVGVETSWLRLSEVSDAFVTKTPSRDSNTAAEMFLHHRLTALADVASQRNQYLDAAVGRVARFFNLLIDEVVEGLAQMLESELEEEVSEARAAQLMQAKISEIAADDFLGLVVKRILGRGLRTSQASHSEPILLKPVIERTQEMVKDFEDHVKDDELTPKMWQQFWTDQFEKSLTITTKRLEDGGFEDHEEVFGNELFTAELMMNIMTHYGE